MLKSVWEDLVNYFRTGNMVARLILINIAIFIGINFVSIFMNVSGGASLSPSMHDFLQFFGMNTAFSEFIFRPWGLFLYMFMHKGFMHILGNMIFIYVFGRIVGDLMGDRKVLPIYIMGGICGAVFHLIFGNILPAYSGDYMIGASASAMALLVAAGVKAPDYNINLIFFSTKLKFIVVALVFLDFVGASASWTSNIGHVAHLGGAFYGWFFATQLNNGKDWSIPFNRYWDRLVGLFDRDSQPRRPQPKMAYSNKDKIKQKKQQPGRRSDFQTPEDRLNFILDKIKSKGRKSLTKEEQSFLDNYYN